MKIYVPNFAPSTGLSAVLSSNDLYSSEYLFIIIYLIVTARKMINILKAGKYCRSEV